MFVFQSKPMTVRDSQQVRTQLWGEVDQASRANDRSWFLDASGRLASEYSKQTDPNVVMEISRLMAYVYATTPDGRYQQVVQDPSTVMGVVSSSMLATTNCPEVRGKLFGDPSHPGLPGLFNVIHDNLTHPDDGVLWSQQQLLSDCVDLVSVEALKNATARMPSSPQAVLSLSILLSSLKTGGDLYQLDEKYNSFTDYVHSLENLLGSSDLRLAASAAAVLGHLDYESQGAGLMPGVKQALEAAFVRPELDIGTRKTIQWALSGPSDLSAVPSESGFEMVPALNPDNFQDAIYGLINASGQYLLLSQMDKKPIFQTVPLQLEPTPASAAECEKFLNGLQTWFEASDIEQNQTLSAADKSQKMNERWEAARQPIDGLVSGEKISQADFALMVLNSMAEQFKRSPDPAIRELVSGKIYPIIEGRLGNLASRVRVGFPLAGPAEKKGEAKKGVPSRPIYVTGSYESTASIFSGSLNVGAPAFDFPKQTSDADTREQPVYRQPQNVFSSSPLPPDQTTLMFRSAVDGVIRYAENGGLPDAATAQAIMQLLQNANPDDFIGGIAGYQQALAAAQAGDLATMLSFFDPNKNPFMRDTELWKSGLLASTRLSLFSTMDMLSVGWHNPTAFNDLYNFIGLADTRYKWCVIPMSADISTYKLFGG
ncbi:MAG: hypothetical protein M1530_04285, partial [Candidatus Marsarchaeota archaeon]|nr:hypothetical protein [Candidatus Marsarchaeota archaeon]